MENVITPWDVKGDIDYDKLQSKFGVKPIGKVPKELADNILFSRGTIFAQRDFERIISAIENKKPFVMMTGLMPTGKMHLGHMLVAKQMVMYQKLGAKIYICVADIEAYHARQQSLADSKKIAIDDYLTNYAALGLDLDKCDVYFQSERSSDAKKTNSYYRLQNILARHASFKEFEAVYGEISPGKMISALLQAADMLHAQLPEFEGPIPVVVPVGIDQDPHIRLARDLVERTKLFKFVQLSSTYNRFMPGLAGGKMSSSDPTSFIALTDSPADAKKKINKYAFSGGQATVEEHRKLGGNPDVDISFQYLSYFFEDDDEKLNQLSSDYKSGKLLSGEMKSYLIDKLTNFLTEHHAKREKHLAAVTKKFS